MVRKFEWPLANEVLKTVIKKERNPDQRAALANSPTHQSLSQCNMPREEKEIKGAHPRKKWDSPRLQILHVRDSTVELRTTFSGAAGDKINMKIDFKLDSRAIGTKAVLAE